MARSKVRIVLDKAALAEVLTEEQARAATMAAGEEFASRARGYAARDTGAGAASIRARLVPNYTGGAAFAALVSWDSLHFYMKFNEFGTKFMPAHPALQPALDDYAQF
jgi:HK97 gp10 family phage protein